MARIRTVGFEIGAGSHDGSTSGAGASFDTGVFRTGAKSFKCNSTAGSIPAYHSLVLATATAVAATQFTRIYFRMTDLPGSEVPVLAFGTSGAELCYMSVDDVGDVRLRYGVAGSGTLVGSVGPTLSTGVWYCLEMSLTINSGSSDDSVAARVDGQTVGSGTGLTIGTAHSTTIQSGWIANPGLSKVCYVDDMAVNDSAGSTAQVSWPGSGAVVLLVPTSDSQAGSWTGGAGGTTNLFDAVNNTPPIGTATETDLTQIESVDASGDNATDEYRANMTTYTAAGIADGQIISVCHPIIDHGEDVATGTKTGSARIHSNPAQGALDTFTFGDNAGALGTWATNWGQKWLTPEVNPTGLAYGTAPVMSVRKTDAGTRVASVDFMGIYVDFAYKSLVIPPDMFRHLLVR